MKWMLRLLCAFLALCFMVPATALADQYCAQRVMVAPNLQCFDTLEEAERFIRVEPDPANGSKYLERTRVVQLAMGTISTYYSVKPRPYESFKGSLYKLFTIGGWGRQEYDCGPSDIVPGLPYRGCPDERTASDGFLDRYPFEGGNQTAYFSGAYMPDPPTTWNGSGRLVSVPRNAQPAETERKWRVVYSGGFEAIHGVDRADIYECPALFGGRSAHSTITWPLVCANQAYGYIRKQSLQYDSCAKDGNPCVASTGNKEYRVIDFDWEGNAFSRAYNSVADFALLSGLGDNWAHTYSHRLILASHASTDVYWLGSDGYFEVFSLLPDGTYKSRNQVGAALFKETGSAVNTHGLWRLETPDTATRWFDNGGRLARQRKGSQELTFTYCRAGKLSEGSCTGPDLLTRVASNSGRTLNFSYEHIDVSAGVAAEDVWQEWRLSYVHADGNLLAIYSYDGLARLVGHGYSEYLDSSYLYAESEHVCRDATGSALVGCSTANFLNHLTGVKDAQGRRAATYRYDHVGRVVSSEHADGAGKVALTYLSSGEVEVSLTGGAVKSYDFAGSVFRKPARTSFTTSDGSSLGQAVALYSDHRLSSRTDTTGAVTSYSYNDKHEVRRVEGLTSDGATSSVTRSIETDWHPVHGTPVAKRIFGPTGSLLVSYAWTLSEVGQTLEHSRVDAVTGVSRTTSFAYCDAPGVTAGQCPLPGLLMRKDGPLRGGDDLTLFTYRMEDSASCAGPIGTLCEYRRGDLWKVTNAFRHVTEYLRYDHAGRPLSIKDANGIVTDMEYHPRGWLLSRKVRGTYEGTDTDDAITRFEYEPTGLVRQVTQPDGTYTRYGYDAAQRLTSITDNVGNRIVYTLDAAGNRIKENTQDSDGALLRTLSRVYNQLGQLQTEADAYANPTDFAYDGSGRLDTTTDAYGRVTDNDYDPLGRLSRTLQDVAGVQAATSFAYDALDNLTKVTDPKGLDTTYTYDGLGNLTALVSPDTGTSTYTYDAAGNRLTQEDARGRTSAYTYDALGRLTHIVYATPSINVTYTYDAVEPACAVGEQYGVGRLTRMKDRSGITQYCYDRWGHLVRKVQDTGGKLFQVRYAYTRAGQLRSTTYPSGTKVDYVRNNLGLVSGVTVTQPGGAAEVLLTRVVYYPFGPPAELEYSDGRRLMRSMNQNYQPGFIEDTRQDGLSVGYGFDAVGNLTTLRRGDQSEPPLRRFRYDALSRLTAVADGVNGATLQAYTYDDTGNRLSATNAGGTATNTYASASHRLTSVAGVARSYDAAGNTTAIGGAARQFSYNHAGRMFQVRQNNVVAMNYAYNGKGEQTWRFPTTTSPAQVFIVYDEAGQVLGTYDSARARLQEVIWLDNLPVGLIADAPDAANARLYYIQPDHLGTPRTVIDPLRQKAVWTWELQGEAFGAGPPNQDPDANGVNFAFDMRYPGQWYDTATGLNYNYFRDYEAGVGRYVQSDPLGISDGPSTYGYVRQNALALVDSHGNSATPAAVQNFRQLAEQARAEAISKMRACKREDCGQVPDEYNFNEPDRQQTLANLAMAQIVFDGRSGDCGYVESVLDPNVITIGPPALSGRCCSLASVVAHEAFHLGRDGRGGRGTEERARYIQQQCFGCTTAFK